MKIKLTDIVVSLDQLMLDPGNFRLDYEVDGTEYPDSEVVSLQPKTQERLEKESLGELRDSIVANGFLEMDRIAVRKLELKNSEDLYLVIEGNRRAAAFKSLIEDHHRHRIELSEDLIRKSKSISVVLIDGPLDQIQDFENSMMGIRHVAGPKKWKGVLSAKLIDNMAEGGRSISDIGKMLGITAIDAGRRRRGYRAFLQMKNDPDWGEFVKSNFYALFLEFVSKTEAKEWLEWDDENLIFTNSTHLAIVYTKLTGKSSTLSQLTNPGQVRRFISYLSDPSYRQKIEQGQSYQDFPSQGPISNEKKIIREFLRLVRELSEKPDSSLVSENKVDLNEIKELLIQIMEAEEA